jgi:hypothetical protein
MSSSRGPASGNVPRARAFDESLALLVEVIPVALDVVFDAIGNRAVERGRSRDGRCSGPTMPASDQNSSQDANRNEK